ncbi:MAG: cell division protein FtsZ, partial [Pseudomonadota bacterium]
MPIDFETENLTELRPKITVIGVGGAGGNAIDNMINAELRGVDFVVANTDAQALTKSKAGERVQLGLSQTKGWIGKRKRDIDRIKNVIADG